MDVAFQMRGVPEVILVDACTTDSEPGTLFRVPGEAIEHLPPVKGINLHAFRWDHALAFARWLLREEYPRNVLVYLVEAERLEFGAPLSAAVDGALGKLEDLFFAQWSHRFENGGSEISRSGSSRSAGAA